MFVLKDGISKILSPSEIIIGWKLDFNAQCKVEFGQYVQMHEEHDNIMQTQTIGAIACRPTGNVQGGYYFISLETGHHIIHRHWTPLPMPTGVIDQLHRMARRTKTTKRYKFTTRDNVNLAELYTK